MGFYAVAQRRTSDEVYVDLTHCLSTTLTTQSVYEADRLQGSSFNLEHDTVRALFWGQSERSRKAIAKVEQRGVLYHIVEQVSHN